MTHTKFIELLNLYLDHQISGEEALQLEHEIKHHPGRLELYRQYCRMQKGCARLADNFRELAPAPQPASTLPLRRKAAGRTGWYAGIGALAAAACLTLIVVNRQPAPAAVQSPTSAPQNGPAAGFAQADRPLSARPLLSMPAMPQTHQQVLQTVFSPAMVASNNPISAGDAIDAQSLITQADIDRLDWMNRVQLQPLQLDDYSFQVRPAAAEDHRTYRSRKPFDGNVEMTAFQFQR
jgi:hypothetical protein